MPPTSYRQDLAKARGWVSRHCVAVWLETSRFLRKDEVAMDKDQVDWP